MGEALKVMFVITAIALVGLLVFAIAAIGHFDIANLTNIAVDTTAAGASGWLPHGYIGIWAAIPFAIWFFLAIEGVPLAPRRPPTRNATSRAASSPGWVSCWSPAYWCCS